MASEHDEAGKYSSPQARASDVAHSLIKGVVGSIPLAGSLAAEVFALVVAPSLDRRRTEWMKSVGEGLAQLEARSQGILDKLESEDAFIDTALAATQIALRTSQQEKLDALRNAVLNSARSDAPELALQQLFLNLVDEFTEWHLRILSLFSDPTGWALRRSHAFPQLYMGGLSSILESAFPELTGRRAVYDQFWRDLYNRGLVSVEQLHTTMSGTGLLQPRSTEFGASFLRFISRPPA